MFFSIKCTLFCDFFKKCYNSNFITYSLLNFVPATYKKNVLILKEDQLIDNAIFITQGRLSLEIAIDLESPEDSINKYLSKNYNPLKIRKDDNKYKFTSTTNYIFPHGKRESKSNDKVKNILEQVGITKDVNNKKNVTKSMKDELKKNIEIQERMERDSRLLGKKTNTKR